MKKIFTLFTVLALTVCMAVAQDCYHLKGKLNGRIVVDIAWEENGENVAAGYLLYPNAKHPAPILVAGHWEWAGEDSNEIFLYMSEYQPDGTVSGWLTMQFTEVEGDRNFIEGTWTNPKTCKQLPLTMSRGTSVDGPGQSVLPAWYGESTLIPEDPAHIGREYAYSQWDWRSNSMLGGHCSFKGAGKGKIHYEICNVPHNIAEGCSDPSRPAVLVGNAFDYDTEDEYGYAFRALFYKKFVAVKTTSGPGSTEGFGMGASFDGVYIKKKQ